MDTNNVNGPGVIIRNCHCNYIKERNRTQLNFIKQRLDNVC